MKYSIFGFSQELVVNLQKEQDGKIKKLDVADLLILRNIADFMNRGKIIKYTIDDKVYFSIQYSTIIEDLPILDIKKQALSDRLDKLVFLNLLEKVVVKNQSGTFVAFRLGVEYERLLYSCTSSETTPTRSELRVQGYSTTNHNTNTTNNSSINKEIDKSISKKKKAFNVREDLSYVAEEFLNLWNEWLDYKDEIKKQYKTLRGASSQYASLVKFSDGNIELATAIVKRSIEQSWDGLFSLTDKQKTFYLSKSNPYAKTLFDDSKEEQKEDTFTFNGQIYR